MFKVVKQFGVNTNAKFLSFCRKFISVGDFVIEVGPGDASFAQNLLKQIRPGQYEFIDIQDKRIFRKENKMYFVDLSKDKLNMPEGTVSVVIASQVFEHIKNLSSFLLETHRVLKDGGLLLAKLPNYSNIFHRLKMLKDGLPDRLQGSINDGGHINFVSYRFLSGFLKDYFELVEVKGDCFVDPFFTKSILGKDRYLINDSLESLMFSWNAMACFKKK